MVFWWRFEGKFPVSTNFLVDKNETN